MADIRIRIDHDQLVLVTRVMDQLLAEKPHGETLNILHSIIEQLVVRLRKRAAERRLEYRFILPVHQGLALRRMVMVGTELYPEGRERNEMRILISHIDPLCTPYTSVQ